MNYIKLICIICATFVSIEGSAQGQITRPTKKAQQQSSPTGKPQSPNKSKQQPPVQQVQQLRQQPKPTTGVINGHEWVDLGLPSGVKWATCNIGAQNPEDVGLYFQWGDTQGWTREQVANGEKVFN